MIFAPEILEDLFQAVESDDIVDPVVSLPDVVPVCCNYEEMQRCLDLCVEFWHQGASRAELIALTNKLLIHGNLPPEARVRYKFARARYKHLRFAVVLFGKDHQAPPLFAATVAVMGKLQDAFRNHRRLAVLRYSLLLRLLLCRPLWSTAKREIGSVDLDDVAGFFAFRRSELRRLDVWLRAPAVSGHVFHSIRKIVSRQVAFYDTMRTLQPTSERWRMSRFLSAINGLMGSMHDDLVARADTRQFNYHEDVLPLPVDIRKRLERLVAHYPLDF